MQLPIDVTALLGEVTDVQAARETPLSVSVYVDNEAPAELAAHVRNAFASSSSRVRMTVSYLDGSFVPHPTDDFAVVVAGESASAMDAAELVRGVGVPVMVATLSPLRLAAAATLSGKPVPEGDVVSPYADEDLAGEWNDEIAAALDDRIGRWIGSACREKSLAFAIAFPFMRRPLAKDAVQITALENAGVGLIPILPGADLPIMTLNQAKMVLQIAAAYGQEMDKNRLKELAFVLAGAYLSRGLARRLVAAVPVLGFVFKTGVAYGTTVAVGYAVIEYFEGGEDATGVANVLERAAEAGAKAVSFVQGKASEIAPQLIEATAE